MADLTKAQASTDGHTVRIKLGNMEVYTSPQDAKAFAYRLMEVAKVAGMFNPIRSGKAGGI